MERSRLVSLAIGDRHNGLLAWHSDVLGGIIWEVDRSAVFVGWPVRRGESSEISAQHLVDGVVFSLARTTAVGSPTFAAF